MSDTLYVGTRKGLFTFTRRSDGHWRAPAPAFLAQPVTAVLRSGSTLYAALNLGHFGVKLHRSTDGGESWGEVAAPAFPTPGTEAEKARSVGFVWTLAAGKPGTDELWAGTLPVAMFHSPDGGESWRFNAALDAVPGREEWFGGGYDDAAIHSVHADPRDPARLTIAISSGGVWRSDDAGASWRAVGQGLRAEYVPPELTYSPASQDPHRLAHCPADLAIVWCQHHNGIFRSTDGALTFNEVSANAKPSAFGFAVAAHPADPDTAWFVPAVKDEARVPIDGRLVVMRTRDGGRSFESLSRGLPDEPSYDLVYRHALDVDESGNLLAMGSTTGNLWISEDGGESWHLVSAHLPPIAQVLFG
jgi:hypothetical protein